MLYAQRKQYLKLIIHPLLNRRHWNCIFNILLKRKVRHRVVKHNTKIIKYQNKNTLNKLKRFNSFRFYLSSHSEACKRQKDQAQQAKFNDTQYTKSSQNWSIIIKLMSIKLTVFIDHKKAWRCGMWMEAPITPIIAHVLQLVYIRNVSIFLLIEVLI